jgi:hypothetical protein
MVEERCFYVVEKFDYRPLQVSRAVSSPALRLNKNFVRFTFSPLEALNENEAGLLSVATPINLKEFQEQFGNFFFEGAISQIEEFLDGYDARYIPKGSS